MIDLFNDDLEKVQPAELFRAVLDFLRLRDQLSERPAESWRFDFKRQWNDGALQDVAGFANTFGGILMIGVDPDTTDTTRPGSVVQTTATHETKLQIASAIATNISPTPFYRITDCADPSDLTKRIWVVRKSGTKIRAKSGDRRNVSRP